MNVMRRYVSTRHGEIHLKEAGEGEAVLLLHSVGCSSYEWEYVIDGLAAAGRRVIAWDMPGHGDSDPLTRHHSIDDFADAAIALLDALVIEHAHVVGESIGGHICASLGARYGWRTRSLVFCETGLMPAEEWDRNWERVDQGFGAVNQTFDEIRPRFRDLTEDFHRRWNIDRNKAGAKAMVSAMRAIRDFDLAAALPKIEAPSLLLWGGKNVFVSNGSSKAFAALLPEAREVILPDSGHFPMIDEPEAFVGTLNHFFAGVAD
jgi:pimeloyl-ACP methyl ester carboxylesterase